MKIISLILLIPLFIACIWDKDTIRDEIQNKASLYDLIIGQVPHHSDEYYRQRLANKETILKENKGVIGINTIAAAHIRLKEFYKAEKILLAQLKVTPQNYYTNSNLGVMYKKMGDYKKAVHYMSQALKIKPEGHMGLGDWYLRMLKYKSLQKTPEKNFLDEEYTEYFKPRAKASVEDVRKRATFEKLIRNDQSFADGFLSLADFLGATGDLNLALRAYMRAEKLGHPKKEYITKKIEMLVAHLSIMGIRDEEKLRQEVEVFRKQIEEEFNKAEVWVEEFKKTETELLRKKASVDYKEVYAELKRKGINSFYPK